MSFEAWYWTFAGLSISALFGLLFYFASVEANGWTAEPVNGDSEDPSVCYSITEWQDKGFTRYTTARGIFCPESGSSER